ncbi:MAG: glutathione synthetase [Epsilonproteobacteria bacterium (ex Lamellibrachia satsuma)]|nr:MAG: glutathione synthetase [Epsilonproteobacteria bacterium (ex Lamellibrachia satsuma)]
MKLGFVLNDVMHEPLPSTTINLVIAALRMGHKVWLIGLGDFAYDPNDTVHAYAYSASQKKFKDAKDFLAHIVSKDAKKERITVEDLDILMLRNDPAADFDKPWAQHAALVFGCIAADHGVIVLNDPGGLRKAINKMYFQQFPRSIRLNTLISKNFQDILEFYHQNNNKIIIKPLLGSGGRNVFLVQPEDEANIKQMTEAVMRDGYVIAQEFFPPASHSDIRLFMVNGRPFEVNGKYAAIKRVSGGKDVRSNIHAGGHAEKVEITDKILELAEAVRPKLVQDGIFIAGLDIVEDKLLEVNVFSPGGLGIAGNLVNEDFCTALIETLEKKVAYKSHYITNFDNVEMNTL